MKRLPSFFAVLVIALLASALQAQEASVEGTLEVLVEDRHDRTSVTHYHVNTGAERIALQFADGEPSVNPGQRVRARGTRSGGVLALRKADLEADVAAYPIALDRQVMVAIVTFTDKPTPSVSNESAATVALDWAASGWKEYSSQKLNITGQVVGPIAVPFSSAEFCASTASTINLSSTIDQEIIRQAGISPYYPTTNVMYAFPSSGCPWWGLGMVGGTRTWVNGDFQYQVVAHELGHNWGLYHSKSLRCDGASCASDEYGDDHDIMGSGQNAHPNAFQKSKLDFLLESDNSLQVITRSGRYAIAPASTLSVPRGLKIIVDGIAYFVETRNQTSWDQWVSPGVLVHTYFDAAYLRDRDRGAGVDFIIDPGEEFVEGDLVVRTVTMDGGGAEVEIVIGGDTDLPGEATQLRAL